MGPCYAERLRNTYAELGVVPPPAKRNPSPSYPPRAAMHSTATEQQASESEAEQQASESEAEEVEASSFSQEDCVRLRERASTPIDTSCAEAMERADGCAAKRRSYDQWHRAGGNVWKRIVGSKKCDRPVGSKKAKSSLIESYRRTFRAELRAIVPEGKRIGRPVAELLQSATEHWRMHMFSGLGEIARASKRDTVMPQDLHLWEKIVCQFSKRSIFEMEEEAAAAATRNRRLRLRRKRE